MSASLSSFRFQVLSGYRRLFRARKTLFQGDHYAMQESRVAIRAEFIKNQNIPPGPQLQHLISEIDVAADMLLHGFARGDLNPETNRYEVKIQPQHTQQGDANTAEIKVEPVTPEMAEQVGQASPKVEVTTTSSKTTTER